MKTLIENIENYTYKICKWLNKRLGRKPKKWIIFVQDISTSMSSVRHYPSLLNRLFDALGAGLHPASRVSYFHVAATVEEVGEFPVGELPRINRFDWHSQEGGMLRGGSSLSLALMQVEDKRRELRERGVKGEIEVYIMSDGYARDSVPPAWQQETYRLARESREQLSKDRRCKLLFVAYVHKKLRPKLDTFIDAVKLPAEQMEIREWNDERQLGDRAEQSVSIVRKRTISSG